MTEKNKWERAGESMSNAGNSIMKTGGATAGCGCLLTIFVTIPIILLIIFIL